MQPRFLNKKNAGSMASAPRGLMPSLHHHSHCHFDFWWHYVNMPMLAGRLLTQMLYCYSDLKRPQAPWHLRGAIDNHQVTTLRRTMLCEDERAKKNIPLRPGHLHLYGRLLRNVCPDQARALRCRAAPPVFSRKNRPSTFSIFRWLFRCSLHYSGGIRHFEVLSRQFSRSRSFSLCKPLNWSKQDYIKR